MASARVPDGFEARRSGVSPLLDSHDEADPRARCSELGAFLRAKRHALRPETLGLAAGRRRRTPGLRREEVAVAAGVGISWYTWLEQGRDIHPSREALCRIARTLRMSPTDEQYLLLLGGFEQRALDGDPDDLDPCLHVVVNAISLPAMLAGPALNVLAFNPPADAIYDLEGKKGPFADNWFWRLFMDPHRRALYVDWEEIALVSVGGYRVLYAQHSNDTRMKAVLKDLQSRCPEFVRMWDQRRTAPLVPVTLRLQHPKLGRLTFSPKRFLLFGDPRVMLSTFLPEDSRTAGTFKRLARRK
jgi:transcriptional regulator with XRE-family HTH domain